MTEITRLIMEAIRSIPPGRVSSYRDAALQAGLPRGARQVVRVLHSMAALHDLPWHRIIRADGSIALESGQGREEQIRLLRSEGVRVSRAGKIDMKKYGTAPVSAPEQDSPRRR